MENTLINGILWTHDLLKVVEKTSFTKEVSFVEDFHVTSEFLFSDENWDFYNMDELDRKPGDYKYKFAELTYPYLVPLKKMVLDGLIIDRMAPPTIKSHFRKAKEFALYLQANNVFIPGLITEARVKKYFYDNMERWGTMHYINSIAYAIGLLLGQLPDISPAVFKYLASLYDKHRYKAELEAGKTPLIPKRLLNKMVSIAIINLQDQSLENKERQIACMIVIFAETGMRIGELARLEANRLKTFEIFDSERAVYLRFKTYKTIRGEQTWVWTKAAVTPNMHLAYKTLEYLREERLKKNCGKGRKKHITGNSKFLYLNDNGEANKVHESTIGNHIFQFMIKHQNALELDKLSEEEIKCITKVQIINSNLNFLGKAAKDLVGQYYYKVNAHQFRVTLCTRLYELDVPLYWICEHMNHIDKAMTMHYIRTGKLESQRRNNILLLRKLVNEAENQLETNPDKVTDPAMKRELSNTAYREQYEAINAFIAKGRYNIKNDLSEVIKVLSITKTPITESEEGFCARSALALICERQEYMSSLSDAYHVGLKLPMVSHAALTFRRFTEKKQIVAYNEKLCAENPKYRVEYEREKKD